MTIRAKKPEELLAAEWLPEYERLRGVIHSSTMTYSA
jgi:hypothetical protein